MRLAVVQRPDDVAKSRKALVDFGRLLHAVGAVLISRLRVVFGSSQITKLLSESAASRTLDQAWRGAHEGELSLDERARCRIFRADSDGEDSMGARRRVVEFGGRSCPTGRRSRVERFDVVAGRHCRLREACATIT